MPSHPEAHKGKALLRMPQTRILHPAQDWACNADTRCQLVELEEHMQLVSEVP